MLKKNRTKINYLLLAFLITACGLANYTTPLQTEPKPRSTKIEVKNPLIPNMFGVNNPLIGFIDLSPTNARGAAPIVQINTSEKLRLSFDVLTTKVPVLAVRFNHHQPNWETSGLPRPMFLEGNNYEIVQREVNRAALGPLYRSFTLEFPNRDVKFKFSGNYSLELFDPNTGFVWASLPFFISEEIENTTFSVEQIYATGRVNRIIHQPFLTYKYPEFVQFPITQVSAYFFKNQFWGESILADRVDQNIQGELGFHPSRNLSFIADDQTREVRLRNPQPDNFRILEVDRPDNNLKVTLQRDTPGLDASNSRSNSRRNVATDADEAEYVSTVFSLEVDQSWQNEAVYLIGDFTNWQVDKRYRLRSDLDPDFPFLKTTVLLKEGIHSYSYIHLRNDRSIDKNAFINPFSNFTNRYHAFIYYLDPETQVHRLLKTTTTLVSE